MSSVGDIVIYAISKKINDSVLRGDIFKQNVLQSVQLAIINVADLRNKNATNGDVIIVKIIKFTDDLGIPVVSEIDVSYDELLTFTKGFIGKSVFAN